ncbi:MAG: hypothetical protein HC893_01650 [Chloroflexaceae bacterium]|nr:hypothetical protein [Chloroflexaceae bacterium]
MSKRPNFCGKCGGALPLTARFCRNCGAEVVRTPPPQSAVDAPTPPERRYCRYCGGTLQNKARFCRLCGAPLGAVSARASQYDSFLAQLETVVNQLAIADQSAYTRTQRLLVHLINPRVTIVFAGHFKAGKSSVLNTLLERPILPTDDLPATGVRCVLRSGSSDAVVARGTNTQRIVPCKTEAIAKVVSRLSEDGADNEAIQVIDFVDITLANAPIPPNVYWVDTPGMNDTEDMTVRATEAARTADVLFWVLYSKQFLSMSEQTFLSTYIAERGNTSVFFHCQRFLKSGYEG